MALNIIFAYHLFVFILYRSINSDTLSIFMLILLGFYYNIFFSSLCILDIKPHSGEQLTNNFSNYIKHVFILDCFFYYIKAIEFDVLQCVNMGFSSLFFGLDSKHHCCTNLFPLYLFLVVSEV